MESTGFNQFQELAGSLLEQVANPNTRAMYRKGLKDLLDWWREHGTRAFDESLVHDHLRDLAHLGYAAATINQRLAAIRRLVGKATEGGLVDAGTAAKIVQIAGVSRPKSKIKSTLDAAQAEVLINAPSGSTSKGIRDRALLAVLVGCGLRRAEVVKLKVENVQSRAGRWFLAEVVGARGRSRTVSVPAWAKEALCAWIVRSKLKSGALFRSVDRKGVVAENPISVQTVLWLVAGYGRLAGFDVTPDDLRRTCAKLCRQEGGDLDQIQIMLGHASIQTTERFLNGVPKRVEAPNIRLRMNWYNSKKLRVS